MENAWNAPGSVTQLRSHAVGRAAGALKSSTTCGLAARLGSPCGSCSTAAAATAAALSLSAARTFFGAGCRVTNTEKTASHSVRSCMAGPSAEKTAPHERGASRHWLFAGLRRASCAFLRIVGSATFPARAMDGLLDVVRSLDPSQSNDDLFPSLLDAPMGLPPSSSAPTQDDSAPVALPSTSDALSPTSLSTRAPNPRASLVLPTKAYPHMHMGDLQPVICNVVGMCHSGPDVRLDLRSIALRCKNAEYHPKRFSAVILRIREPRCTALCFESGKIIVTGALSVEASKLGCRKICKILKKLGQPVKFLEYRVQNMVAVVDMHRPVCLENFASDHTDHANYEPELFPAVIFHMMEPKCCCLVFVTGKMVITGAKSREHVFDACEKLYPLVKRYFKRPAVQESCDKC